MVILATNEAILEAYDNKNVDIVGRPQLQFSTIFTASPTATDVMLSDWGREWEVLRRVTHTVVRQFQSSPQLPQLECDIIDSVVDLILTREGINKPFNPSNYVYLMIHSITASLTAGTRYSIDDPEFLQLKKGSEDQRRLDTTLTMIEFFPILRYTIYYKEWRELESAYKVLLNWCEKQLIQHIDTYERNQTRDICDGLIHARIEAESRDKSAVKYLHDHNLVNSLQDMFQAGSETTRMTFMWIILLMANYPEVQMKLRNEVDNVIGSSIPSSEHRSKCDYVNSFISECLRFRPNVPLGFPHKCIKETKVAGQAIPSGTTVTSLMFGQLHDPIVWTDPSVFKPERFLDPGTRRFNKKINRSNLPFSLGRRSCLGEKLALLNMFMELTRILQKTKGYFFVLPNGPGSVTLDHDPVHSGSRMVPVQYEVMIVEEGQVASDLSNFFQWEQNV